MTPISNDSLHAIDPLDAARILGYLFGSDLDAALAQRIVAAAALTPDTLPDDGIPSTVEGHKIGGRW